MEPSLALQALIRAQLVASPGVVALVPTASILDRNSRPETFPLILIGEGQTMPDAGLDRTRHEVFSDLHVWTKETGLAQAKTIVGAVRVALATFPRAVDGLHVTDLRIASARFMRDPDGLHAHAVVSVVALVKETTP